MAGFFIPGEGGFAGMVPRMSARLLAGGQAQNAVNTELFSGELKAFRDLSAAVVTPSKVGTKKTIYRFGQDVAAEGQYWFHWLDDVDVVRGPVNNDASERTYWTGEAEPRVTDSAIALLAGTDYPMNWYKLGIPKPAAAPGIATDGTGTGDPFEIAAVYTYVSAWGEEGPPSDPSPVLSVKNGDDITISGMSVGPGAGYNITAKRIYIGFSGNTAADYQLFAEVLLATVNHGPADFQSEGLDEVIRSRTWDPPPAGLKGLVVVAGAWLAGFLNNDVWQSEPIVPSAWPAGYRKSLPFGVVGLGSFDRVLVAMTKGNPYAGSAADPASLVLEKIAEGRACVAKRGIVSLPRGVCYPCAEGLAYISSAGWQLVTDPYFTARQWRALVPESISAWRWSDRYVAFYDDGAGTQRGFIFDPADPRGGLLYIDVYATAGYNDPRREALYLQVGNDIVKWDGGAAARAYTWKSKVFVMPKPINPGFAQVIATSYPVTMKLYADGVLKHTAAVANAEPFRLPAGYKARDFEVQLEGSVDVRGVAVAESIDDLRQLVT
jgi:hypothetical protein